MEILAAGARTLLHLDLSATQLAAFMTYADELRAWNEKFNLTSIKDLEGIQVKHFLDSLSILKVLSGAGGRGPLRLIDVGTGAGFPGLPLKIVCSDLRLTLVEATGKKVEFCQALAAKLQLSGVTVVKVGRKRSGTTRPTRCRDSSWSPRPRSATTSRSCSPPASAARRLRAAMGCLPRSPPCGG
jgi:16S rRNA (guanine527-N7)-methyltransferase